MFSAMHMQHDGAPVLARLAENCYFFWGHVLRACNLHHRFASRVFKPSRIDAP